jgi:hypothetical protein
MIQVTPGEHVTLVSNRGISAAMQSPPAHRGILTAMTEKALLELERQELKSQLANGRLKTLVDVVLDGIDHLIPDLGRGSEPAPPWVSAALFTLGLLAIDFWTSVLFKEDYQVRVDRIPSELALALLTFAGLLLLKSQLGATFALWRDELIDALEAREDLDDIRMWFESVCDIGKQLLIGVPAGFVFGIYAVYYVSDVRGGFIGRGPSILDIVLSVLVFLGLYYVVLCVNLPFRVRRYRFRLFGLDPRRSRTIRQLSGLFLKYVYGTGCLMAAVTLVLGVFATMKQESVLLLLILGWAPVVFTFVLTQYSLSGIINRAKWRMLDKVQERIGALESERETDEKSVLEMTHRLLDLQDRIWASRSSVLDIGSALGLFNALLLPLITFVVSNYALMQRILTGGQ